MLSVKSYHNIFHIHDLKYISLFCFRICISDVIVHVSPWLMTFILFTFKPVKSWKYNKLINLFKDTFLAACMKSDLRLHTKEK